MAAPSTDMKKLVLDSKALAIWDHKVGPVFWYALGVPGPFYLNTEQMLGKALADTLLAGITEIVASSTDLLVRSEPLHNLIMDAYLATPVYQAIIQALVAKTLQVFPQDQFNLISGGERRDWLFSIPVAHELGVKHAYLFKDQRVFCKQGFVDGERVLHIADLINNAASYFDMWLPMLADAKLNFVGTACVNTRGANGVTRMTDAGYKIAALNAIDLSFFDQAMASGLIDQATRDELALFFKSSHDWAARYLMKDVKLYDVAHLDKKSFERLTSFFEQDPWALRVAHADFFIEMEKEIARRKS